MRKISIAALVATAVGTATLAFAARPHPAAIDAKADLVRSLGQLRAGNYSAARNDARAAIDAEPGSGLAHAILARAYLALGQGIEAEAELDRAGNAGFDPARMHQLYAHAWLLQGNPQQALIEAAKTPPRFIGYATRVAARALAAEGDVAAAERMLATVLAAAPDDSAAWSDLGRVRLDGGDNAGATDAATRAIALDRGNVEALVLRGELVRANYGLVAALPWFEDALRHDAYYHPALIEYAATLGDAGRYGDMLAAARRALLARPGSPQALYLLAILAARAGDYDLSRGLLQRTGDTLADLPGALMLGGTLDYQAGSYEQAILKWRELVARQPMNIAARRLLGAALLRSGDAAGALDALRPVALRGDADSYTLSLVARAFEQTGRRDWAATYADRAAMPQSSGASPFGTDDSLPVLANAAADDPGDPVTGVAYLRGLIDAAQGGAALDQARALVRANPGAPPALLALGDTLAATDRWADAANAYRRAADIAFDEPTMLRLVDALDRTGHRPQAAAALALFLAQNPQSVAARRLAAHWQIAAGDWPRAIATLQALRGQLGNRDIALLTELAVAYTGGGDADTGAVYAKAAYTLAPMDPAACDAYGWALYQQGDNDGARQLLEKAVAIVPGAAGVRWHLAQADADLGRKREAAAQIRAALADPAFADRTAAQAVLKTLV